MKSFEAILATAAMIALAGCVLRGKPPAAPVAAAPKPVAAPQPAPPPPQLSVPQTNVQLPPPQPVNPDALAAANQTEPPEAPPTPRKKSPPIQTAPVTQPRVDTAPPPATVPAPAQPEPERPRIQEILPAAEQKLLLDRAAEKRRNARQILDQMRGQRLNKANSDLKKSVEQFLSLSEDAERRSDARGADALAERAQVLARELQGAR